MFYHRLADAVLVLHFGVVLFVLGGLITVVAGNRLNWRWVNQRWFRLVHLAAIGVVAAQAWCGQACPLTTLESWLRMRSGARGYDESFLAHWLQRLIYYELPAWAFTVAYTAFALLVVLAWWRFPPRREPRKRNDAWPSGHCH